eukprot:3396978-Amphidinium_carterae.1
MPDTALVDRATVSICSRRSRESKPAYDSKANTQSLHSSSFPLNATGFGIVFTSMTPANKFTRPATGCTAAAPGCC